MIPRARASSYPRNALFAAETASKRLSRCYWRGKRPVLIGGFASGVPTAGNDAGLRGFRGRRQSLHIAANYWGRGARRHSSGGANPARQLSPQPVEAEADDGGNPVVRSTPMERAAVGGSATVRAAT